jgi:hypothetical protein
MQSAGAATSRLGSFIQSERTGLMKVSTFAAFWAVGFFLASNPAIAATTWPSGTYFESCNGCTVQNNSTIITCNCRRGNGTNGMTSINFGKCIGRSVINNSGTLQCAR